jgi:dienelactone hydrolase
MTHTRKVIMQSKTTFSSSGKNIQAELFEPDTGTPNGGAVIIVYGSFGMLTPWGEQIRDYADALSKLGFISTIPDYFTSTNTAPGIKAFPKIDYVNRAVWENTIKDAISYTQKLKGVDQAKIGLLGFSLGGHLCLRLRDRAKVLVEYFAPELDSISTKSSLNLYAQIHHGEADELVPFNTNAEIIKNILINEGLKLGNTLEFFSYLKANHRFHGADLDNSNARKDSMDRTLTFFKDYL